MRNGEAPHRRGKEVREFDLFALARDQTLYHLTALGEVGPVSDADLQRIVTTLALADRAGPSSTP